jgi:Protein of unknown function (DUF3891)
MLLRTDDQGVLAIGQSSHAWVSGQLARAWGNDSFPAPEPWEDVCLAAEQHDIGMALWDLDAARDSSTGQPYSFMEMPLELHLELWGAAPRRLMVQNRYAALLVSMHGSRLYRRRDLERLSDEDADRVLAYLAEQERVQLQLLDSLRSDPATAGSAADGVVAENSQLIWVWDFASLVLCLDWAPRPLRDVPSVEGPVEIELSAAGEPRRLSLDPWPFAADHVSVRCEGRRLGGPYESDDSLRDALTAAPWETVEFELVRARA